MEIVINTISDLLTVARNYGDKPAIICDDKIVTYAEFVTDVDELSELLVQYRLCRGDRVMIVISGKVEYMISVLGVMNIGGIAVPCGADSSMDELAFLAEDVTPKFMIMDVNVYKSYFWESDCRFSEIELFIVLGNNHEDNEAPIETGKTIFFNPANVVGLNRRRNLEQVTSNDAALIMHTSGTGGRRKGVLLSHKNLIQTSKNIKEFMQVDESIREYVTVPLTHAFGFGRPRCVLLAGGTLVFDNGMFNPARMARSFKKYSCNAISGVSAVFALMFSRFEHLLANIGPAIRHIEIGSATMKVEHKLRLMELCPNARICMNYGLTEASRGTFMEFHSEKDRLDTIGTASPNTLVAIVDDEVNEVKFGVEGEIVVKGDNVAMGYWNQLELTKQKFSGQWFRTGDYGTMSEDGYIKLLGRKDDIINVGGDKVSPLEVEHVVRQLYPQLEFCVFGVPDANGILGEVVALAYEPSEIEEISIDHLTQYLKSHLEWYKIPKHLFKVEKIPKTQNGKVSRNKLKSTLLTELE